MQLAGGFARGKPGYNPDTNFGYVPTHHAAECV
jgi:hypothetical protein